jgi:hypothetical protein
MSEFAAADESEATGTSSVSFEDGFLKQLRWVKLGLSVEETAGKERRPERCRLTWL